MGLAAYGYPESLPVVRRLVAAKTKLQTEAAHCSRSALSREAAKVTEARTFLLLYSTGVRQGNVKELIVLSRNLLRIVEGKFTCDASHVRVGLVRERRDTMSIIGGSCDGSGPGGNENEALAVLRGWRQGVP